MSERSFAYRVFIALSIFTLFLAAYVLVWRAHLVLLVGFAGLLFGIFLNGCSKALTGRTRLSYGWALTLTVFLLCALLGVLIVTLGPGIVSQLRQLGDRLPQSPEAIVNHIRQYGIGKKLLDVLPPLNGILPAAGSQVAMPVARFFSHAASVLGALAIAFITGIYLAASAGSYRENALQLLPPSKRHKASRIASRAREVLWWWMLGRLFLMVTNGVLTTIGLEILRIPLAFSLGALAAALSFMPAVGPVLALIPAILIAFMQSPAQALWVLLFFLGLHALEGYVLTPLVVRQSVSLPAAVTLLSQLLFGLLFGLLGLFLATPIAICIGILLQTLYVEEQNNEPSRRTGV